MPELEAAAIVEEFQELLLQGDRRAAAQVARAMGEAVKSIEDDLLRLMEQVEGKQLSFAQVQRLARYEQLLELSKDAFDRFTQQASGIVTTSQGNALSLANQGTRLTVDAALPAGINTEVLARLGIQWNRLPVEALSAFTGISGDGKPLSNLLTPLGPESTQGVIDGIQEGIAKGFSPRKTARTVRDNVGMSLTRALRISRTETMRAYRESTRVLYRGNSDVVKGWRRHAQLDGRTCMACIALDGTLYETRRPMDAHPNCRCAMVPETIGYADLGLDVPEDTRKRETGPAWFRRQPDGVQRQMMGPRSFEAWKDGKFEVEDMVKITRSPVWGASASQKPLKDLLAV